MKQVLRLTICGGGNLGHVVLGYAAALPLVEVRLLTRRPEMWADGVEVKDNEGRVFVGVPKVVTADARVAVEGADVVLLCLPGYAIEGVLEEIAPYVGKETVVGSVVSSTGFFFAAERCLKESQPVFGCQRVPFVARMEAYGKKAWLKGYKAEVNVAMRHVGDEEKLMEELAYVFGTPVRKLGHYYEAALTNSNPLLHPARLYTLFGERPMEKRFEAYPLFYEEWTDEASELLIEMDGEFQGLLEVLGVRKGAIPSILDYYECGDAGELTEKMKSIEAFKGIGAPVYSSKTGFRLDRKSRYFTEDFPYGLRFVVEMGRDKGVKMPAMERVYEWGKRVLEIN